VCAFEVAEKIEQVFFSGGTDFSLCSVFSNSEPTTRLCACALRIAKIKWLAQAEACATKGFADILAELVR
jgi:hypothetical protein